MGWYTTCVCTTHHPINHCQLSWARMHPISTITHLPFDCHQLCASPSYFGPLPAQFHPSQQLPSIDIPHHCCFSHTHTSTQCLWATTIHPPPLFPPLHHQSVVAHATHVICLLHCGLGCPPHCGWVGVLVVLGDGLGESWLCGR